MKSKHQIFLLISVVVLLLVISYPYMDEALEKFLMEHETVHIDRVIDGDTVVANETSIRLLGINSPERGEIHYAKAKEFLEDLILNKTIRLEFGKEKEDRYGRTLAYLYIGRENINLKLVENGYANIYFPSGRDTHYNKFAQAWEECIENNKNLCEKSEDECSDCIGLKEFDYENEIIVFYNKCNFDCELTDYTIKDEGRKNFIFPEFILKKSEEVEIIVEEGKDDEDTLFWEDEKYVWTRTGDSLFLRDDKGKLVLWDSY